MLKKDPVQLSFALAGVRTPLRAQQASAGRPATQDEPFCHEALALTRRLVLQREVELDVRRAPPACRVPRLPLVWAVQQFEDTTCGACAYARGAAARDRDGTWKAPTHVSLLGCNVSVYKLTGTVCMSLQTLVTCSLILQNLGLALHRGSPLRRVAIKANGKGGL